MREITIQKQTTRLRDKHLTLAFENVPHASTKCGVRQATRGVRMHLTLAFENVGLTQAKKILNASVKRY